MAKIVIDTNEFIDILKLDEPDIINYMKNIENNINNFIFPKQIIDETIRHVLIEQKSYSSSMKAKYIPYDTKVCKLLKNSKHTRALNNINKDIMSLRDEEIKNYNKKTQVVIDTLSKIKNNSVIPTTSEILKKAAERKTCGNPPCSNSRIGDEIIWETILSWAQDDIVIVSNDHTFHENLQFLQIEYARKNKKLLGVFKDLTDATKLIGEIVQEEVVKIEKKEARLKEKLRDETITTISKALKHLDSLNSTNSIKIFERLNTNTLFSLNKLENSPYLLDVSKLQLKNSILENTFNNLQCNELLPSFSSIRPKTSSDLLLDNNILNSLSENPIDSLKITSPIELLDDNKKNE